MKHVIYHLVITFILFCVFALNCVKSSENKPGLDKPGMTQSVPYTWNNISKSHEELAVIEKVIRAHIGWVVNNKDQASLYATLIDDDELFFFQPDSKSIIKGINEFKPVVDGFFMRDDL